jgi:hypothetical protein
MNDLGNLRYASFPELPERPSLLLEVLDKVTNRYLKRLSLVLRQDLHYASVSGQFGWGTFCCDYPPQFAHCQIRSGLFTGGQNRLHTLLLYLFQGSKIWSHNLWISLLRVPFTRAHEFWAPTTLYIPCFLRLLYASKKQFHHYQSSLCRDSQTKISIQTPLIPSLSSIWCSAGHISLPAVFSSCKCWTSLSVTIC